MATFKCIECTYLVFLFISGRADDLTRYNGRRTILTQESIYPYYRKLACMLQMLIVEGLFLYFISLVHALHRAKHSTSVGETLKLSQYGFLY